MAHLRKITEIPERIFAIGDIHGCALELESILNHLKNNLHFSQKDLLIFIGDYIDRGPDSKRVIDDLIAFQDQFPKTVFLKGNHEDMLLSFLGFPGRMGNVYIPNGGASTLASYGMDDTISPEKALSVIPQEHLNFFSLLTDYAELGDYVFVHAGLSPIMALDQQLEDDLFWIRDEFIMNIHRFEKIVVFGHTPYHYVMFHLPFKIGIDTGLVYGNMLTCIELNNQQIYQVKQNTSEVLVSTFADWVSIS